ncbi:Elongator protein 3/MiaB/NifB [hydrothermal vent metagenome]|uniref:Elongator protein 3/MiaB/NifB n=1 Tax=hydrothermal vent metagenome TaxID=652676 RepID=A0A3B0QRP8_9ZZZZ
MSEKKKFHIVLIKPSHYDSDGYVIRWFRSAIPSNSLALLYGLSLDLIERGGLGADVEIILSAYDDTNKRVPIGQIIKDIKRDGGRAFIGMVGVQTNQFTRAVDLSMDFKKAGLEVCIGGFHVSGCIAMLDELPPDIQAASDSGISLFAGEAEGRVDELMKDAFNGKLKPVYNYLNDLPDITNTPVPFLPIETLRRSAGSYTSFDAGRGCPFKCSFCSIINVQGQKSRQRSVKSIEKIIRTNMAQGIQRYFVTDDNFARNSNWEEILDCIIAIRENDGVNLRLILQVDTKSHLIPGFIAKAKRAGVGRVFIGIESINSENLKAANKGQNDFDEYRRLLQAWRSEGIITFGGYITGFPADTYDSVITDVKTLQRELPVDLLEFFFLTPLPGSVDHKTLYEKGEWMEPDMNKYNTQYVTTQHPLMSKKEWERAYDDAWDTYYSDEHIETVLKRALVNRIGLKKLVGAILWFYASVKYEKLHPLESGIFRRKFRTERRPGLPLVNPLIFYPKRLFEVIRDNGKLLFMYLKYNRIAKRIKADPKAKNYMDKTIDPVS